MTFLIITTQLIYSVAQSYLGATVVCQKPVVPHWGRLEYIYLLYSTLQQKTHTRTPCPDLLPHCYGHPSSTRSRPALLPDGTLSLYHAFPTKISESSKPEVHYDVIKEGPGSTVVRTWIPASDDPPEHARWIAVKSAMTQRKFAREPHDIMKELQVLSSVTHGNVFLPSPMEF